jgi:hypothetical protein
MEPYEARAFRFRELLSIGEWRMKSDGHDDVGENPLEVGAIDPNPESIRGSVNGVARHERENHRVIGARIPLGSSRRGDRSLDFERETWIKHILHQPNGLDFDGHLAERLNEST